MDQKLSQFQSLALSFRERQANSARKRNCDPKLSLQDISNQSTTRISHLPKINPRATSTLSTQSHLPVKQSKLKLPRLATLPAVNNRQDSFVKNWPDKMLSVRERAKLRFQDRMRQKELELVKKLKQAQDELHSIQNEQRQTETELQVVSPPSSEVKYKKSFRKSRISDVEISSENATPRSVHFSSRIHRKHEYSSDFTDNQLDKPVELKPTEAVTSLYESTVDPEQGIEVETFPCNNCGRPFVKTRLAKHRRACKKAKKPRKVFDSMKQRLTGVFF